MEKVPSLADESLMDYQHPDEIRDEGDLCSLFAQYEAFTDEELLMSGTGWPEQGGEGYNQNAHTKLTQEQLDYIYDSGEPISQWIRGAVQERIEQEKHYKRANEAIGWPDDTFEAH